MCDDHNEMHQNEKTLDKKEIVNQELNQAQLLEVNEDQLFRMLLMVDESLKSRVERCLVWIQLKMATQKLETNLNMKIEAWVQC